MPENITLKLSHRYRIGRLFWPTVLTIGLSGLLHNRSNPNDNHGVLVNNKWNWLFQALSQLKVPLLHIVLHSLLHSLQHKSLCRRHCIHIISSYRRMEWRHAAGLGRNCFHVVSVTTASLWNCLGCSCVWGRLPMVLCWSGRLKQSWKTLGATRRTKNKINQ